jgi:hypothetical protein
LGVLLAAARPSGLRREGLRCAWSVAHRHRGAAFPIPDRGPPGRRRHTQFPARSRHLERVIDDAILP